MITRSEVLREPERAKPVRLNKVKDRGKGIYQNFDADYAKWLMEEEGGWELYESNSNLSQKASDVVEKNLSAIKSVQSKDIDIRQSKIIAAIESLPEEGFTKAAPNRPSKPKIDAISAAVGFEITPIERDIAWKLSGGAVAETTD